MAWTGLTLTVDGRSALNRAQTDGRLCFKSLVVGDGNPPANFGTQKGLVHELYELTDIKIDMTPDGCALTADFPALDYDYYFREIGVTVVTEDGEKLYVYDNCGDDAQYIVSSTGAERTQKRIRIYLAISDVADITVSAPSILYVDYDDYEQEIERLDEDIDAAKMEASEALAGHTGNKSNPHAVTKAQVGLGNVNNTSDANKPVSTAQQAALDAKLDKTGDVMSGMLDIVYDSGQVKVFCDSRGGHVWIYNTESKKVLQIVCEEDEGKFYLVDTSDTPTCTNFMHLTSESVNTGHDITVGAGAENGRLNFISPLSQRSMWVGFANSNGNFYIWDTTNNKAIISAPKTGVPTFHGHATSDLALTGGTITGNLQIGNTSMTDSPDIHWLDKFRNIWAGMCNGAGDWYLYDATNQKAIIHSTKAGVTNFYGNATSATNADTVDGKHASDLQNYNNLTNRPTIPNSVAVKGNKEGAYRQGNVNLTPANIGAVNTAGDTMTGTFVMNNGTANTPCINWISTLRHVWAGCVNSGGTWYLWDTTNNKAILQCDKYGNTLMQGSKVTIQPITEVGGLISSNGWIDIYNKGVHKVAMYSHDDNDGWFGIVAKNVQTAIESHWDSNGWSVGLRFVNNNFKAAAVIPYGDGTNHLGYSGTRWNQLWAANATITTSDRNYKEEIEYLSDDYAKDIIMHLKPASFKFKNKEGDIVTHDRRHFGFIAQDIEDDIVDGLGMSSSDLGFFIKSSTKDIPDYEGDLDYIYSLRYEEFISVAIKTIQAQQKRIDDIECRLQALESEKNK